MVRYTLSPGVQPTGPILHRNATDRWTRCARCVAAIMLAAALAIACSGLTRVHVGTVPEAELTKAGLIAEAAEPAGYISADAATRRALEGFPNLDRTSVDRDVYLLRVTHEHSAATGTGLVDRPVWLIWFSGLSIQFGGPSAAPGETSYGHVAHFAYVLVDASSGELLESGFLQ